MAAPSMVTRDGDNLVVRSVVSGDTLFGTEPTPSADLDETPLEDDSPAADDFLPQTRVKRNYSCPSCEFTTQNPRNYLHHLKDDHKQKFKIFECPRCLYASRHSQKLHRHMHMVHVLGALKRKPRAYPEREKRLRRLKPRPATRSLDPPPKPPPLPADTEFTLSEDGTAIVYKCSVCEFTSKSQTTLVRHERVVHLKKKFFRCNKCDYATHIRARFTKHVKYHSMPMIKCDVCDFRTPYKWNLERHNKNHQGDGAFKCYMCNFTADIKQSLTVHELNHHSENQVAKSRRRYKVGASDMLPPQPPHDDQLDIVNFESREANHLSKAERIAARKQQLKQMRERVKSQQNMQQDQQQNFDPIMGTQVEIPVEGHIRVKCSSCLFSHESLDEVRKHEAIYHQKPSLPAAPPAEKKKAPRPIPNLIPITSQPAVKKPTPSPSPTPMQQSNQVPQRTSQPSLSIKDLNELCYKSAQTSALKDFASIIGDENAFNNSEDVKPAQHKQTSLLRLTPDTRSSSPDSVDSKKEYSSSRRKASSFFNKLQERLMAGTGEADLLCSVCGYQAKCLSELVKHKESLHPEEEAIESATCQQCGLVCSSPAELQSHSLTCNPEPDLPLVPSRLDLSKVSAGAVQSLTNEVTIKLQEVKKEPVDEDTMGKHPMENKVFVWNYVSGQSLLDNYDLEEISITAEDTNVYLGTEIKPGYGTATIMSMQEREAATKSSLNVRKAFKCPHCDFWASTASRFHVHIVGHLNKRPFRCSLCQYSSNWRWDITKHIRLKGFRDPGHQGAKVLLTDEAGMRDYAKYGKFLALIKVEANPAQYLNDKKLLNRNLNMPGTKRSVSPSHGDQPSSKRSRLFNTKKMWKCKKCQYRNSDRTVVLAHVRSHYQPDKTKNVSSPENSTEIKPKTEPPDTPPASDSEKADIPGKPEQQHPPISDENDDDDEYVPDFMCETCPYISESMKSLEEHCEKHFVTHGTNYKCKLCPYYATDEEDLNTHCQLHDGTEEMDSKNVLFTCLLCPYSGRNKSQLSYHKKWHYNNTEEAKHKCRKCSYSAPSSTILVLHARLHRLHLRPELSDKDLTKLPKFTASCSADISGIDTSKLREIPLAWVCKGSRVSKMFKCRFCPHVNIRKPNIQEHEKMHTDRSPGKGSGIQHRCNLCNYVCNNAGVLSSHFKVHQAFFGTVVAIADPTRPDKEQIDEVKHKMAQDELNESKGDAAVAQAALDIKPSNERLIHFCSVCPARFLYPKELLIHSRFHVLKLPFRCETCSYTARQRQHLFIHKKVHTNDYHERTKILLMSYSESLDNPRPKVIRRVVESGQVWVISTEESDSKSESHKCPKCPAKFSDKDSFDRHFVFHGWPGKFKCKYCDFTVLSFDSLIQHELLHTDLEDDSRPSTPTDTKVIKKDEPEKVPKADPEFGSQIHGSPDFVYPTTMRNGKPKEKKYKCHKCPTAFEKREQYKVHLTLHGAKQKYKCEKCDYSVKYYANYIQHVKKHNSSETPTKDLNRSNEVTDDLNSEDASEDNGKSDAIIVDDKRKLIGMCLADAQTMEFIKQREAETKFSTEPVHRCPFCPYTNSRRDAVISHLRCHSATTRGKCYSCNYCDYKVPQGRFFKEHIKSHFAPMKYIKPDCYMKIDQLEIWAEPVDQNDNSGKFLVFKDQGEEYDVTKRFLPEFDFVRPAPPSPRGRVYINLKTGEEEMELDEEDKTESSGMVNGSSDSPKEKEEGIEMSPKQKEQADDYSSPRNDDHDVINDSLSKNEESFDAMDEDDASNAESELTESKNTNPSESIQQEEKEMDINDSINGDNETENKLDIPATENRLSPEPVENHPEVESNQNSVRPPEEVPVVVSVRPPVTSDSDDSSSSTSLSSTTTSSSSSCSSYNNLRED